MENNFLCFTCQQKPIEFTILSCDHLICSTCLENRIVRKSDYLTVQCRCGRKTLSNEDSMMMSLKTPEMAQVKKQLEKMKSLQNDNTEISNFLIHESDISSKQNTLIRNKENINNQNQKYTFNPCGMHYSKQFLKTQPLNLDESNPFFMEQKQSNLSKNKIVKGVKSVQSIKSMSPSQKVSEKVSPRKRQHKQTPKKVISSIYESTAGYSSDALNSIAKQLQKELKFIQIQYQKQIQTCQKAFKKIVKSINLSYQKLVSSLQKFYLEQAAQIQAKQKDQLIFGLPKIVKKKYESTVGKKIIHLSQKLLEYFDGYQQKKGSQRQRQTRETVFLTRQIDQKSTYSIEKNYPKKSKSKTKECALYLAISPKRKNDKVVSYIDVIRKDTTAKLLKKGNLSKKVIKGDKIRIY